MATSPQELFAQADAAIDWYWKFGAQRAGSTYEISRGTWLDEIYRVRNRAGGARRAEGGSKPVMALWGPSQTGKSTLLSGYLDDPADDRGERSALCWSSAEPVRFVVGGDKGEDVIVLNPFNFQSDASGCVSRFVLRDSVADPAHPIEIEFAAESQIILALATGYLSECEAKNARGETTVWSEDSYKDLLGRQKSSGPSQRPAFEALQQLAETVDLLILAGLPRYANLEQPWKKFLRAQTLESPALLVSVAAVEAFACELIWDNWASLTQTYNTLVARRRQIAAEWGGAPVRCSLRTAAILLDIDSYKKYSGQGSGGASAIRRKVDAITVNRAGEAICLGQGPGAPLVRGADDFGALQALVWELRIPLRRDVLRQRAHVLAEFFERADLLDFPGVANNPGNAKLHTDAAVRASPEIALTEVLKRGKTASVVLTSARNLDIDGFSILVRLDRFPGQPKQLFTGIKSWMESYDPKYWPPKSRVLPLNLVITFSGALINQVRSAGTRDGLQPVFDRLKSLAYLADAKVVSTFATNYPQFDDGKIHGTPDEQRQALDAIVRDAAFRERFGDSVESFHEMHANGGTDHVFRALGAQAAGSHRAELVAARLAESAEHLRDLLLQHAPGESAEAAERERALDGWRAAIQAKLAAAPGFGSGPESITSLSFHLRTFVNVDPEQLDDIPQKALTRGTDVRAFIEKQFRLWQSRRAEFSDLGRIGLEDGSHARRVLSYLIEAADLDAVEEFFCNTLGHLNNYHELKYARRFLAVEMNNALLDRRKSLPAPHRPVTNGSRESTVIASLEKLAAAETRRNVGPDQSPQYLAVIAPFLRRLQAVKAHGASTRPPQIGDAELLALIHSLPAAV
jgi:hypothetical protein